MVVILEVLQELLFWKNYFFETGNFMKDHYSKKCYLQELIVY